jgi:integrase
MAQQNTTRRELPRFHTVQALKSLRAPGSGSTFYFDKEVPGLALRITANDVRTWTLFYRIHRRQRCLKVGRYPDLGLADARELARGRRALVAKGGDPAGDRQTARNAPTFGELTDLYLKLHAQPNKKASSCAEDKRMIESELASWKRRAVRDVTRLDVQNLLDAIVARGARVQANRVRALISKLFNFGVEREIVELNPVLTGRGVKRPTKERSRERVLSPDEIRAIWNACSTQRCRVAAWFRLRLTTAQRGSELLRMRWQDVDGEWWTIPGEFTKNGTPHRVYLNPSSRSILEVLQKPDDAVWVFPTPAIADYEEERERLEKQDLMGDYRHVARRVASKTRANVRDFQGRDLRRTAATYMTASGVSRDVVKRVLNHAEGYSDITAVYDRYSYDREKKSAMDVWDRTLTAILEGKKTDIALPQPAWQLVE